MFNLIQLSDSVAIAQYGTEETGTVIVTIDNQFDFSYPYSPESPCRSFDELALMSMAQC